MTDEEEAIEQLKCMKVFIGYDAENPLVKRMQSALDIAIDALKQTRWILCSERLPKESGDYFVTISFDIMGGQEPVREVYKDYFSVLSQKWLYHGEDVIAWMPLPESYKESEE